MEQRNTVYLKEGDGLSLSPASAYRGELDAGGLSGQLPGDERGHQLLQRLAELPVGLGQAVPLSGRLYLFVHERMLAASQPAVRSDGEAALARVPRVKDVVSPERAEG